MAALFDDIPKPKTRKPATKGSSTYRAPYILPSDSDEPLESYGHHGGSDEIESGHPPDDMYYDAGVAEISATIENIEIDIPLVGHASADQRGASQVCDVMTPMCAVLTTYSGE